MHAKNNIYVVMHCKEDSESCIMSRWDTTSDWTAKRDCQSHRSSVQVPSYDPLLCFSLSGDLCLPSQVSPRRQRGSSVRTRVVQMDEFAKTLDLPSGRCGVWNTSPHHVFHPSRNPPLCVYCCNHDDDAPLTFTQVLGWAQFNLLLNLSRSFLHLNQTNQSPVAP